MRFDFDEEQVQLRQAARGFLEQHSGSPQVRAAMETSLGYDPAIWARTTRELGWTGLTIAPEYDGFGWGCVGLVGLMEEMGRVLFCTPYFSTVCLGANAISRAGSPAQRARWLPRVASGECTATLAWQAPGGAPEDLGVRAERRGEEFVLSGSARYVVDGHSADVLVVVAQFEGRPGLFLVPGEHPGVTREALPTLDLTRKLAQVDFDQARLSADRRLEGDARAIAQVFDVARVALAAELVGGAERCLEMAVEYAGQRHQFGRPIGSFQAVKHMCADMLVAVESARSATYYAAWTADHEPEALPEAAAIAKAYASEAYFRCAADNIQVHGGIGFTWEHDAHLYFKRAQAGGVFLGDADWHRARIADWIL